MPWHFLQFVIKISNDKQLM